MDASKWAIVHERTSVHYQRVAGYRYDPTERLEKSRHSAEAARLGSSSLFQDSVLRVPEQSSDAKVFTEQEPEETEKPNGQSWREGDPSSGRSVEAPRRAAG
jgi:hypothetical protein